MIHQALRFLVWTVLACTSIPLFAQQRTKGELRALARSAEDSAKPEGNAIPAGGADSPAEGKSAKPESSSAPPHKIGSLTVSASWRFRTEPWPWFQPTTGEHAHAFSHSLLRLGIAQQTQQTQFP